MRKSILSVMGVAASALAFAQVAPLPSNSTSVEFKDLNAKKTTEIRDFNYRSTSVNNMHRAPGAVLWTETFGNGLAGDASNGAWTTSGTAAAAVWEYRGASTTPDNMTGSQGAYTGTTGPIGSPTRANGFFIFDSDYLDNGGVAGNFGGGAAATPHVSYLTSPTIDLSSQSVGGVISFNSYYRRFVSIGAIEFSGDNGTTWTGLTEIYTDATLPTNSRTDSMNVESVYIPTAVGTSATFKFRFVFDGQTDGDGYYFWQVDDISISEAPDNDLALDTVYYESNIDTGYKAFYSIIPMSQVADDSLKFSAKYSNNGTVDQPNTKFVNSITTPTQTVVLQSTPMTAVVGVMDSVEISSYYKLGADGLGNYTMNYGVVSDSTEDAPADNMLMWDIEVSDSTYARDFDAVGNRYYGEGVNYEIGNMFDIWDTVKATSISVRVGTATEEGSIISLNLLDGGFNKIASRDFITLDASQIGTLVTFDFPPIMLEPGQYIVTMETFSDIVCFPTSANEADPQTVFVDPDNSGATWYYSTSIPAVRLNVSDDFSCLLYAATAQTGPGEATCTASNGTAPYSYAWSNGATTDIASNLPAGTHTVTVTDDAGCSVVNTVVVECLLTVSASQTANNEATAVASSGTTPYSYLWSNGETTDVISGVPSGVTYTVTVTDAANCVADTDVNIVTSVVEMGIDGQVTLFPNPTNGEMNIKLQDVEAGAYQISVMNMVGQTINVRTVNVSGNQVINLGDLNLTNGMYFVEVSNSNEEKSVIRVIVK